MKVRLKTHAFGVACALLLSSNMTGWAASPISEAVHPVFYFSRTVAHSASQLSRVLGLESKPQSTAGVPTPARFRESDSRGLLVRTWINGSGPYTFAIDTGAGATILSPQVASRARIQVQAGAGNIRLGGLSGQTVGGGRKAFVRSVAIGTKGNTLPGQGLFIVAPGLPADIDGVLDPTECFAPFGYIIDMPRGEISAFDPRSQPLSPSDAPAEGTVVQWLRDGSSRRPFVLLTGGRRALIDTGSSFGLAVDENAARSLGILIDSGNQRRETRDLAGGRVEAERIRSATVHVGSMALRGVPTDLLTRAEKGAPVLLGRDALRPFRLTFDPVSRLIMFQPV